MHARNRLLWLSAVLCGSGCVCFVPVDEPDGSVDAGPPCTTCRDAGTDAGIDAGVDAGVDGGTDAGPPASDGGCMRATQCTAPPRPTSSWCSGAQPDAGYSCVANACLWECPTTAAGRSCIVDMGSYCLRCGDDAGTPCPTSSNCGPVTSTATVEMSSTCTTWPGTTMPFTAVSIQRTASAQCRFMVSGPNQSLGEFWRLDDGEYLAYFPGFGGWCTGRSAFTGVQRGIFNCPACQFVLEGFE